MKRLLIVAVMIALAGTAACKDGSGPAGSGTLIFAADFDCPTGTVELSIDRTVRGQYAMHPGTTIQSFVVSSGQHTGSARMIGGQGFVWDSLAVIVPADRTVELRLIC